MIFVFFFLNRCFSCNSTKMYFRGHSRYYDINLKWELFINLNDFILEYLSHYPCIKTAINFLHDCMDQQVITLKEITLNPVEDQIPKACCTFNRYIECSTKQIKKLCSNDSTAIEYIANKMIKGRRVLFSFGFVIKL